MLLLAHALFVVSEYRAHGSVLRPSRLRIFGASDRIEVNLGYELAIRDLAKVQGKGRVP